MEEKVRARLHRVRSAVQGHQQNLVFEDTYRQKLCSRVLGEHQDRAFGFSNESTFGQQLLTFCGGPSFAAPGAPAEYRRGGLEVWSLGVPL